MNKLLPALTAIALLAPAAAAEPDIKPNLKDPYLTREFEWSAYIHVADAKNTLNYPASKLRPVTKVSVTFKPNPQAPTQVYEEFWYHQGKPLGMRRLKEFASPSDRDGAIVLGADGDFQCGPLVNALARVLVDFHLRHLIVADVLVPKQHYQSVVEQLAAYGFKPLSEEPSSGEQFSLNIRSQPYGLENRLYLSK